MDREENRGNKRRSLKSGRTKTGACLLWAAVSAILLTFSTGAAPADERKEEKTSTTSQLYAQSAVLMDADNGRVLLQKNGTDILAMASTTKIMTCILTLEQGNTSDMASVSAYAAGQPKVHLGAQKGERYKIEDLLYSLMLESHNDAAVIIAEHYGSAWAGLSRDCKSHSAEESRRAVLAFTTRMNEKAKEIGCENTFFVTPNGLDATLRMDTGEKSIEKEHSTTAQDLARIMSYCVTKSPAKDSFLQVTRTASYTYHNYKADDNGGFVAGSHVISCNNHNAFLQMMDGALSGKTGFTGKAGYCYVGALERDGKRFSVALLACGWPNHKTWKWHDTEILMKYGLENFEKHDIYEGRKLEPVPVRNGQLPRVSLACEEKKVELLLSREDEVKVEWELPRQLTAPVKSGDVVGKEVFYVNGEIYAFIPVTAAENVPEITYSYCIRKILQGVLL